MKNIAIVNLTDISSYFYENIKGKKQIDIIKTYSENLPYIDKIIYLTSTRDLDCDNLIFYENWNKELLINTLFNESKGYDNLFYYYGDCPLLDKKLTEEMFGDHINYYAEYTFADGYPYGLTPEILDVNILEALTLLAQNQKDKIDRNTIFDIVKKDINSFELETKISEKDVRLLRVSLTCDSKRNFNQLLRIINSGGTNAASIIKILDEKQELLFVEPSYLTLEITKLKKHNTTYLPERVNSSDLMNISDLDKILAKMKKYSEDVIVSFVPEYEPTTHPELLSIIKLITNKYNFELFMETGGIGWSTELVEEVKNNNKIKIIVTLDAINQDIYTSLRGFGQAEAESLTHTLINNASDRIWVQATRMKNNEADMEPFFRHWQKFTSNIIIQKYSDYCKRLPDLKVADLSPLKRFPCWHLKRDLHINSDGFALICFYDTESEYKLGSLLDDNIETIMERKKDIYIKQINCNYTKLCGLCDEYYTYNF